MRRVRCLLIKPFLLSIMALPCAAHQSFTNWNGLYEGSNVTALLTALRTAEGIDYHMKRLDANADGALTTAEIQDAIQDGEQPYPAYRPVRDDQGSQLSPELTTPTHKHRELLGALQVATPTLLSLPVWSPFLDR